MKIVFMILSFSVLFFKIEYDFPVDTEYKIYFIRVHVYFYKTQSISLIFYEYHHSPCNKII